MRLGPDSTLVVPGIGQLWLSFNHFGGYYHEDTHINAFSHTHMVGPGANDWGNFGVMVSRYLNETTIANSASEAAYRSGFSHANETATAGYYAVHLTDADTYAEMTVSGTHSGVHRYTCNGGSGLSCTLLLDVCHTVAEGQACKQSTVSVSTLPGTNGSTVAMQGSILHSGGLSGRGPLGGVWVYIYMEVTATHAATGAPMMPVTTGIWTNNTLMPGHAGNASTTSGNMGGYVTFPSPASGDAAVILVRAGLSFVDVNHAQANLYTEQQTQQSHASASASGSPSQWVSFDAARAATTSLWESWLGRFAVSFPPDMDPAYLSANQTVFYSALYRAFLAPTTYSEPSDGSYVGMDQAVHVLPGGASTGTGTGSARYLSDMSIWDTHRSQAPFLAAFAPDVAKQQTDSLVLMAQQGGHLARWPLASVFTGCMDGSHAVVIMGDQIAKRVPGANASAFYPWVAAAITAQDTGSRYAELGWVPIEDDSSHAVTSTLEYAYDDGIAATIAEAVGDAANAALWRARAGNYRNVFNPNATQMCPRYANGSWACPWSFSWPYPFNDGYLEGDPLQYQTFAPHDQAGLMGLFPSPQDYVDALQSLQEKQGEWPLGNALPNPYYWAGNEPDILAPWQFAVAGNDQAWRTQYWTRWLLARYYTAQPDGIPGNDDFGTMSAWAAFAYLGLYPIAGTETYALGSPFFASVNVTLPASAFKYAPASDPRAANGFTLQIVAHNASANNFYVASAAANGQQLPTAYVNHSQLFLDASGLLEFWMTDAPVTFGM